MNYTVVAGLALALPMYVSAAFADENLRSTLTLNDAIDMALQNSPRIKASEAALSGKQGAELQAGVWENPEIGIEVENLSGSGPYKGTRSAELTYLLSQKIELGKRPSRVRMAQAERVTASLAVRSERLDIARDVKIAYTDVLAAERTLQLAEQQEKLAEDVLANVAKRVGAARDPLIYKSQAEVSRATAKMARAQALRDIQLTRKKLASLLGGDPLVQGLDENVLNQIEQPASLESYQTKLAESPDLTRFTSMKLAKAAAIRLEKAQNIPDPSINVGFRTFRESSEQAMIVGVSMPIPVLNQNQGNIAKARAEMNQVENESLTARLNAEQALQQAWQEWELAYTEATQLRESIIPSAEKAFTLAREGYERGRFSYLEILNAQRTLYEALGQYNQSLKRQAIAKAQVQRLTAEPVTILKGEI